MFSLFKRNKDYPGFWLDYKKKFQGSVSGTIENTRFVVFDTETTGFDFKEDRILSIGAVTLQNSSIDISQTFEKYIAQEAFNPDTVKIHGIIKNDSITTVSEEDVIKQFLLYIENAVLVAHHIHFDVSMVNQALKRMGLPKLKNKMLDTMVLYRATRINSNLIDKERNYSLDEVAENLNISVKDRHTAAGDAMITAIAFLKIVSRLTKKGTGKIKDLLRVR